MRSLRLALIGLGLVGFAAGIVSLAIALSSDHLGEVQSGGPFATPLIAWSFIATGLFAWWRRPENKFGALMTAVGFVWFLGALLASDVPALYVIGGLVNALPYALLVHMLVAFPSGRLETRWERILVGAAYFDTTVLQVASILFLDTTDPDVCVGCPANPLQIGDPSGFADAIAGLQSLIGVAGLAGVAAVLIGRWRSASTASRRAFAPILVAGVATAVLLGLSLLGDLAGFPNGAVEDVIDFLAVVAMASVPVAFLIGLLRSRLSRADAVGELVSRLGEADRRQGLREAIAEALGDPTLTLLYWVPEQARYVDADGHPVALDSVLADSRTPVQHEGRPVAMICHDASLEGEPELLQTVAGAAGLALENERLNVELRARIEELQASRARIVQAADDERRRLERDLHDGAQQRLVSLALNLRLASAKLDSDPPAAKELLTETATELGEATTELRELARGLHPAVLSDRGLGPALEALAGRAPVPVELGESPDERLPAAVESASYFVVAEALTNIARYAEASRAEVSVSRSDGEVEVEVRDDGVGGADPADGSGLRGLADRVAALEGRLEIVSPPGGGTTVRAVIPCA